MANLDQIADYLAETCNGLSVSNVNDSRSISAWYYNGTMNVTRAGYEPVAVVGYGLNQAVLKLYKYYLNGNTLEYGVCHQNGSSNIGSLVINFYVLYRKIPS